MKEKEVQTKELYPFVSDAIKKMDISLENIQWAHKSMLRILLIMHVPYFVRRLQKNCH